MYKSYICAKTRLICVSSNKQQAKKRVKRCFIDLSFCICFYYIDIKSKLTIAGLKPNIFNIILIILFSIEFNISLHDGVNENSAFVKEKK